MAQNSRGSKWYTRKNLYHLCPPLLLATIQFLSPEASNILDFLGILPLVCHAHTQANAHPSPPIFTWKAAHHTHCSTLMGFP